MRRRGRVLIALVTVLVLLGVAVGAYSLSHRSAPEAEADDPATAKTVSPLQFGAVGDGARDDTGPLRTALSALRPGDTLSLPTGKRFRHTDVLRLTTPRVLVTGGGTLVATDPQKSAFFVQADDVTMDAVTLALQGTTQRLGRFEHMKLTVLNAAGFTARRVRVEGSAAAGVYLWGARGFVLTDLDVRGTKADGIHITGPSRDGLVQRPVVRGSGDDGVAVVSYQADGVPVRSVTVEAPQVLGTTWGRGLSVVGGEDVTMSNVKVDRSNAAAVYIAREGEPWNSFAPVRVMVDGGTISGANTSTSVDHGAVLVYDGRSGGEALRDVTVRRLRISDTRSSASRQVGFLREPGSAATGVRLLELSIVRGPRHLLTVNAPSGTWEALGWTQDYRTVPDRR